MKITLFGASGMIGSRILAEALQRGHTVTTVVRNPAKVSLESPRLKAEKGDLLKLEDVKRVIRDADVVISAYSTQSENPALIHDVSRNLVEAIASANPKARLIAVSGAAALETAPGKRLIDDPNFPMAWKGVAQAHVDAAHIYEQSNIAWTLFSPAAIIEPGTRTGKFRVGKNQLIANAKGDSRISAEDFAVALLDELDKKQYIRSRMTVGY